MLENVGKSKILLSLVAILLMVVLFGSVYSFAADSNTVTITATTNTVDASNNTTTNNTTTDNTTNTTNTNSTNVTSIVSASSNNTVNNTTNNTTNNTSTYSNTNTSTNTSSLPYTGANSKTILLVIVFAASAFYAYKKVSDYNI